MKFSAAGMELLKRSEGFSNRVYMDVAGLPTIGYGHQLLHSNSFPNGINEQQATNLLACDVRNAEQLLLWDHSGGQEMAALKARRQAEVALWHNSQSQQEAAA